MSNFASFISQKNSKRHNSAVLYVSHIYQVLMCSFTCVLVTNLVPVGQCTVKNSSYDRFLMSLVNNRVEFEDVHRLADGQVKHSPEVFYAGSLWKVSYFIPFFFNFFHSFSDYP